MVLCEVWEVLVEVCERVLVRREVVVDHAQGIARARAAKTLQVHHIERADVVRLAAQVVLPVTLLPKPVTMSESILISFDTDRQFGES